MRRALPVLVLLAALLALGPWPAPAAVTKSPAADSFSAIVDGAASVRLSLAKMAEPPPVVGPSGVAGARVRTPDFSPRLHPAARMVGMPRIGWQRPGERAPPARA